MSECDDEENWVLQTDCSEMDLVCAAGECVDITQECADAINEKSYIGCEYFAATLSNSQLLATSFTYAIAIANMPASDILTGTNPDHVRIIGIDGYTTDRVRTLVIKNRLPGNTGIGGFPYTAGTYSNIPGIVVIGMDGNIGNASGHEGRPHMSEFQTGKGRI